MLILGLGRNNEKALGILFWKLVLTIRFKQLFWNINIEYLNIKS